MTYIQLITAAAKTAKVSAVLLYAICAHESRDFTLDYAQYDNGSPSYGVCQIKENTARLLGYQGDAMQLRNAEIGIKYAALYLAYQVKRYGDKDWVKLIASYNAGSFIESVKRPGCPKNLRYVNLVKQKLKKDLQNKLICGIKEL